MSKKLPWFPCYAQSLLTDENVRMMNNTEFGIYWKLICYCWIEGSIPADINKIARLIGEDSSAMAELWLAIKDCFISDENHVGRLVNPRLEDVKKEQTARNKERAESGRRGAKSRWGAGSIAEPSLSHSSAIAQPMAQAIANDSYIEKEIKQKKEKEKKEKESLALPDWLPKTSWHDFLQMRKEKGNANTPRSLNLLIKKLEYWKSKGFKPEEILDNSTANCWTGLYAPDPRKVSKEARSTVPFIDREKQKKEAEIERKREWEKKSSEEKITIQIIGFLRESNPELPMFSSKNKQCVLQEFDNHFASFKKAIKNGQREPTQLEVLTEMAQKFKIDLKAKGLIV